ncbi:MAG TPA: hypothetical protein VIP29_02690 [Nitrososphaeraceae archaeon]
MKPKFSIIFAFLVLLSMQVVYGQTVDNQTVGNYTDFLKHELIKNIGIKAK